MPPIKIHELPLDEFERELTNRGGRVEHYGSNPAHTAVYSPEGARLSDAPGNSKAEAREIALQGARRHYRVLAAPKGPQPLRPETIIQSRDASEHGDMSNALLALLARGPVLITTAGAEFVAKPEGSSAGKGFSLTDALKAALR